MTGRQYFGVMALLASTALSQVQFAQAQEGGEAGAEQQEDDALVQQTIVVRGAFIPDEKRSTSEVSSVLDAGDFDLQGDSDVASALRRVTGVSIADDRFVIVRGLNERYSSSTLNGSPLPSPEPLRRVAPLDLFPTSVLESTLVQKTFSPEQSAEFGGGSIDIRTKSVPNQAFLEIGGSVGANTETTFKDAFLYDGSDTDPLTYDDGVRDLPAGLEPILAEGSFNDLPGSENREFARSLLTDPRLLVVQEGISSPDYSVDVTGGQRFDLASEISMGLLFAGAYSNEWATRGAQRGLGGIIDEETGELEDSQDYQSTGTSNTSTVNALGAIGFDLYDNHEIQFTGFITRSSEKEARVEVGKLRVGIDNDERREVTEWIERELWTTQVRGDHVFPSLMDLSVDWRASYSEATREAPYQISVGYSLAGEVPELSSEGSLTSLEFSTIEDESTDLGVDLLLPILVGGIEVDLKAGYAYVEKDRQAQNNQFTLGGSTFGDASTRRVDTAFAEIFASDGTATLDEQGGAGLPGFYIATLESDAGYFGVDAQLTPFLRAAIGARYEDAIEVVQTRSFPLGTFETDDRVNSPAIEEDKFYPAATLTWNFADNLQLRVGYSETITRPQFRELAPSRFVNTETDRAFFGNPFLTNTEITNYDGRLEYYFDRDQFVTLGLFYKELENPIEEIDSGDESGTSTFINVPEATIAGFEFEYEQVLPVQGLIDWAWVKSKDFTIKTNYTYTESEVDAAGTVLLYRRDSSAGTLQANEVNAAGFIEDGRELQGQSEHLVNLQFGYTDEEARSEANVLVNFTSERIRTGESPSAPKRPATIEEPPVSLDFVYNKGFTFIDADYEFGLKVQNILGDEYEAYQETSSDRVDVDVYDIGTSLSVSLKRFF